MEYADWNAVQAALVRREEERIRDERNRFLPPTEEEVQRCLNDRRQRQAVIDDEL